MKKLVSFIMTLVIIIATSVVAFADVTVYVSSSSEIPTFRSEVVASSLNVLSESSFNAQYASLASIGFPVQKVDVSLSDSDYVAIRLTDYVNIKYSDGSNYGGIYSGFYVGDANGSYVYEVPETETTYTYVAIAGATGYCLTDRPAGTTGSGYLGDLLVTQDNLTTIHGVVDGLGGDADYYMVLRIVNGEYRYYIMCTYPNRTQYFVCNTSGQLFYALRDEVTDDGDTDSGSSFDATEVITAINSVYDAVNSMSSNLGSRLATLINSTNGIASSVETLGINMVTGFTGVQEQLSTLTGYFSELSGLFPVQETITLFGSDTRVAWDSADRITNVTTSGFNGDLIVKERPGDLVDESGYEKVELSASDTEYRLYNDANGYRRVTAANEYPQTTTPIPQDTLLYFPFDGTTTSSIGDITLKYDGDPIYSAGINGDAFVFNGADYLYTNSLSNVISFSNGSFTLSFWVYLNSVPSGVNLYKYQFGVSAQMSANVTSAGVLSYSFGSTSSDLTTVIGSAVVLDSWNHVALSCDGSQLYCFLNGDLDAVSNFTGFSSITEKIQLGVGSVDGSNITSGSMIDDLILIDGRALWTSSFDAEKEGVFGVIVKDYFLSVTNSSFTLNFYDTTGVQTTEYRWNQYTINTSRLPNGYTEVEYIEGTGTQGIDSQYIPQSENLRFTIDFIRTSAVSNKSLFGSQYGSSFSILPNFTNSTTCYLLVGSSTISTSSIGVVGTRYLFDINANNGSLEYSANGSSFSSTYTGSLDKSSSLGVLCNHSSSTYKEFLSAKLYSCQIYDNGTLVRDFVPCINPSSEVGLYDLVNAQFYGNVGTGSFIAGNEVSNGSSIGQLVGVVSSADRNAYPDDGISGDFYYVYTGSVTDYPYTSLTLTPTDVNGNAITMGRLEDDFSEIYMDINTMQWYCHDPQTQTEILLSSANQQIMNETIYVRQSYTILPADQITADALQNLLPVDSPVYLDMPDGAKLTITYDHYSGWFRMMYMLMDKQTKLLSDLDIVNETIINVENTVIDITNSNPAYNVFYITKTDGSTESVGDAAKDAAVFVGDVLSMFYRLVFDDALDNVDILEDFEGVYSSTEVSVW